MKEDLDFSSPEQFVAIKGKMVLIKISLVRLVLFFAGLTFMSGLISGVLKYLTGVFF